MSSSTEFEAPDGRRLVARPRVSHEIIDVLRQDIASGRVPRGARLPNERELARQFGVSQPTVREAMRALDALGLIEVRHGSGAYALSNIDALIANSLETLLQIERVGILEVLEVRGVLGAYSAGHAVRTAHTEDIDVIQKALETISTASTVRQLAEAVVSFQVAFAAASHNPLLLALESFLINLVMRFQLVALGDRGMRFWREWTSRPHPDRIRLVEILRERDEEGTVRAMVTYLGDQREAFASNPPLTELSLSDPNWIRRVAKIGLDIPDYLAPLRASIERAATATKGKRVPRPPAVSSKLRRRLT